jgi:hypothetical protein
VADLILAESLTSKKIGHAQQKGQLEVEVKLGTNIMAIQTKCPKVTPEYFFSTQRRRRDFGEMLDRNNVG